MLLKNPITIFLLSGLVVAINLRLPCLATDKPVSGNIEKLQEKREAADEANRKSTIRQLWAKYQRLGTAAFKKNDLNMSLEMFEQAVQEAELLNFDQADLALSLDSLAIVYQRLGKVQDSIQAGMKALKVRDRLGCSSLEAKIGTFVEMADTCLEISDYANAKTYLEQAMSLSEANKVSDVLKTRIMDNLLVLCLSTHDKDGAKTYISELLSQDKRRSADENSANHLEQYARMLWQEGQLEEASHCLSRALSIRNACQSPDHPELIALSRNLVRADLVLGISAETEKTIGTVLSYDRMHLAPNSPEYLFDLLSLAELKLSHGELEPARQLCEGVLTAKKESKEQSTLDMADAYSLLGRICAAQKQWYEARGLASQACSIRQSLSLPDALSMHDYETLAIAASAQGQVQESESFFRKELAIRKELYRDDKTGLARAENELQSLRAQIAKAKNENHLSEQVMMRPQ